MSLTRISDDDLPRVFTPTRQDPDSWRDVVGDVVKLATEIATTEFVPKGIRNSVPATAAAMLYGREVGLPPMTALTQIHVIEGRPGMSAEGMRALVFAAGHELVFDEATGAVCRMRARRAGSQAWTELSWSIDMARAAGLLGGRRENWTKYPRAMLIARCTTDLCRMIFPDVIHGFRSTEEIVDMGDADTGAPVAPPPASGRKTVRRKGSAPVERPVDDLELPAGPPLPNEETHEPEADPGPTPTAEGPGGDAARTPPPPGSTPPTIVEVDPGKVRETVRRQDERAEEAGPRLANRAQIRMLHMQWGRLGLGDDRPERLALVAGIIGREVESSNDLTAEEAQTVTATIASVKTAEDLRLLLAARDEADESDDPLPLDEGES